MHQHEEQNTNRVAVREINDRKRGRLPLPPEQKRKRFSLPLSEVERDRLHNEAMDAGLPLATFIRSAALRYEISNVPEINREKWGQAARWVGNFNQLNHSINSGRVTVLPEHASKKLCSDLEYLVEIVQLMRKEMRDAKK
ncbi:MAG: hypothetical protein K1562_13390 [Candidatus Thiodiazotropha sp. (ex. Lucinisca nassula)]|nr:hypothetical protein [Candidatus Thiodiazotropha sp. (ex. Lucinisca nassula)]